VYRTERLTNALYDLGSFSCGNHELDFWLREHAAQADSSGSARVYLWVDDRNEVVAYYATAPWTVERGELPSKIARGKPQVVGGMLIAKLALSVDLRGQPERNGSALLADAVSTCIRAMRIGGGQVVLVDAIDNDALSFYEYHGFRRSPEVEVRLFKKASTAAKELSLDWP